MIKISGFSPIGTFVLLTALCFCVPAAPAPIFARDADIPARNTVIELNAASGAKRYQVQIRAFGQVWANPYTFNVDEDHGRLLLKIRLSPGRYSLRTRSLDVEGFHGNWSAWQNFPIVYEPPKEIYPAENAEIKPKSGVHEALTFEWPTMPKADRYLFVLRDAQGKILKSEVTKHNWLLQDLELAASYTWTAWALGKGEDPVKVEVPADQFHTFRMQGPAPGTRDTQIEAHEAPRAIKYRFEFLRLDRKGERGSASIFDSDTTTLKLSLAPGAYEVRVRTFFDDGSVSDWSPPSPFFVPYRKIEALAPVENARLEAFDDEASPVDLKWTPQNDVSFYTVFIYEDSGKFLKRLNTEVPALRVTLPHDKTYHWLVVPYAAGQSELKPPEMPTDSPKFTVGHYIPLRLGTAEEPSQTYAWGRYFLSDANFTGYNYDLNTITHQQLFEGAGELAIGYWSRKTRLGVLAHAEISGFWLDKTYKTYNYTDAGADFGYRYLFDDGGRLRFFVGPSMHEAPEIVRDYFAQNFDFHRVRTIGTQLQLMYTRDLKAKPKYGWNAYGIIYRPAKDFGTPNHLPYVAEPSFTFGFGGTYMEDPRHKWMLGYSYREENLRYKSADRSGNDNRSSVTGHYLTLTYEYGLADPHK